MISIPNLRNYNGSKSGNGVYQQIISIIPPHKVLVVPFLGHCGVVRNIMPADILIGMDASANVINSWCDFLLSSAFYNIGTKDLILKYGDDCSVFAKTNSSRGNLPSIVVLKKCNALEHLQSMASIFNFNDVVIYADPPYPFSSRKSNQRLYEHEMSNRSHYDLLSLLVEMTDLKYKIAISTYDNPLYKNCLASWNKIDFSAGTRNGKAIETVYFNYSLDNGVLHDYRFLGKNFKDRERIRLKIKRWCSRLQKLNPMERMAIISAIEKRNGVSEQ